MKQSKAKKVTIFSFIMTLGIVYGDIGTSPLYVMSAIVRANDNWITREHVLGGVSLVIWTLTLQTTIKYVLNILNADNHGEGGILSLFTLIKKKSKLLIIPAIIGSAALLADSVITPPVTVSSAIEGLSTRFPLSESMIIIIVALIITALFLVQRFGTEKIGRVFGSVMLVWFSTLLVVGIYGLSKDLSVIAALNPWYGLNLLLTTPVGVVILGAVFLCTTGAEALYSDLGHVGKKNIYYTWIFVKTALIFNYLGQAATLLQYEGQQFFENPFYATMPSWFMLTGVLLSTLAAIIASQSLISGSFTLVSEAIKLNIFPRLVISYPTDVKGQVYLPAINTWLWMGCMFVLFHFKKSANMEAAYGLSITIAMLMTTVLYFFYLRTKNVPKIFAYAFLGIYVVIEGSFLYANIFKFFEGGYITILIGMLIMAVMYFWMKGREITSQIRESVKIERFTKQFEELQKDANIPQFATNLVYLTKSASAGEVEQKVMYSILNRQPKKAQVYWFVHVEVTDEPYTMEYKVETIKDKTIFKVNFSLGFRVERRVSSYLRMIIQEMYNNGELETQNKPYRMNESRIGDVSFVLINEILENHSKLSEFDQFIMRVKLFIKKYTVSPSKWFGLETSNTYEENMPLLLPEKKEKEFTRVR